MSPPAYLRYCFAILVGDADGPEALRQSAAVYREEMRRLFSLGAAGEEARRVIERAVRVGWALGQALATLTRRATD